MKRLVRAIANHLQNVNFTVWHCGERSTDASNGVDCLGSVEHLKLSFFLGNSFFHAILYMHMPCHSGKIFCLENRAFLSYPPLVGEAFCYKV